MHTALVWPTNRDDTNSAPPWRDNVETIVAAALNAREAWYLAAEDRLGNNSYGGGPSDWLAYPHPSGGLRVRVNPGHRPGTGLPVFVASQDPPTLTAPVTNPRIDLLSIDTAGAAAWTAGTESATPSPPALPGGRIALWSVYLRPTGTAIDAFGHDTGTNSYLYRDYRNPAGGGGSTGAGTTDELPEGVTNLYFTDARARAAVLPPAGVAGRVVYTGAGGILATEAALAYDAANDALSIGGGTIPNKGLSVLGTYTGGASAAIHTTATLVASGNTQSLYGVNAAPTFTPGGFTGLSTYALRGWAANGGASNYGVHGQADGAGIVNYGVYGRALSGSTNWAGYFADGDVKIENGLNVGGVAGATAGHIRNSGNVVSDGFHQAAGLRSSAAVLAVTDNAYDIGASGATRFRDLYLARDAYVGGRSMAVQPAARVTHNTTQTAGSASATALAFNTEDFDTDTIHDTVTNNSRLTAKTAGKYLIVANMDWGNMTGGNRRITQAVKNGSTIVAQVENPPPATSANFLLQAFTAVANLAVNDYVEMKVYQDSAGSYTVPATTNGVPAFSMAYLGT